ncbi:hypothetical protein PoB_005194900 [Plakobranchus ocellatus]|uniref:Uncharacterized protein n=1 Tax=Plakobranchus ocellatus TaxID=259542 RepID=A0AAV4BYZ3_9GAST|nr:hypothetical protein PoB_005194900 [Plakobranchus ocellatus]
MSQELQQRDIITADEGIKIRSIASKDGPLDAALYLLTRIHCHKESWYTEFLEVLWVMDLKDLVRDIDDKFHAKKTPATDEDMNHSSLSPTSNESTEPHFERQEPRTEERFPLASGSSEQGDVTVPNVPQESFVEKAPGDNSLMKAILDQMKELTTHQGACVEALAQVSNRLEVLEGKVDLILESL